MGMYGVGGKVSWRISPFWSSEKDVYIVGVNFYRHTGTGDKRGVLGTFVSFDYFLSAINLDS